MNFWTYGVHIPFQARKELIDYFQTKADPKSGQRNPTYAGMIKHTDDAIGKVWKAVEEAGLADKTVILFYSDNGGVNWGSPIPITDNSPLRGGKGDIYEGGVRVPGFVIWPGVTKPGSRCDLAINTRDLFPTLAEICSLKDLPKFDGRSVAPALAGKAMEERPVFTHYPHYGGGWSKGGRRYHRGVGWLEAHPLLLRRAGPETPLRVVPPTRRSRRDARLQPAKARTCGEIGDVHGRVPERNRCRPAATESGVSRCHQRRIRRNRLRSPGACDQERCEIPAGCLSGGGGGIRPTPNFRRRRLSTNTQCCCWPRSARRLGKGATESLTLIRWLASSGKC